MPENETNTTDIVELRSESVQEILTAPPGWMIKWNNTVILLLITGFLLSCWFIKYPDVVNVDISVDTAIPSENIFAGRLIKEPVVLDRSGDSVRKGQPLIILDRSVNYRDLLLLQEVLDTLDITGDSVYATLSKLPSLDFGEIGPLFSLFKRDALVYTKDRVDRNALADLIDSWDKLKIALDHWDKNNIVRSPRTGKVSYSEKLKKRQVISTGDLLFRILPHDDPEYIGKATVSAQNISKIRRGQEVIASLPPHGTVTGVVDGITINGAEKGSGSIIVRLDEDLISAEGIDFVIEGEILGTAKIITEELRLIERFFAVKL